LPDNGVDGPIYDVRNSEASKIAPKHLLILEPGISESLTEQMRNSSLQLVVPHYDSWQLYGRSAGLALESQGVHMVGQGS
ncbi:MAG: type II restriction endonuclease, partial [Bryobacterales bacterium]|nr:type II restriction endonuclease [Bryobacterales bacterium]